MKRNTKNNETVILFYIILLLTNFILAVLNFASRSYGYAILSLIAVGFVVASMILVGKSDRK